MRHIDRFPLPEILSEKWIIWTRKFIEGGQPRPSNNQYAHKDIVAALYAMSSYKCFYCERVLKPGPKEVDHYIEVNECKHLAFFWQNLYLACDSCNDKFTNKIIPAALTLDPCFHTDDEIEDNLTFENELIRPKNYSDLGSKTIQKYKLDSPQLDYLRLRDLSRFKDLLLSIRDKQIAEGRINMTMQEKEVLRSFAYKTNPFSLMFKVLLEKHGLL